MKTYDQGTYETTRENFLGSWAFVAHRTPDGHIHVTVTGPAPWLVVMTFPHLAMPKGFQVWLEGWADRFLAGFSFAPIQAALPF